MGEKDVELLLEDGMLTLKGEKQAESQDEGRRFSERFYGRFVRQVPVGDIEEDKVEASFKDGVLTVTMPKTARAQEKARRIAINSKAADTKH
jgi:HSP20 family protein